MFSLVVLSKVNINVIIIQRKESYIGRHLLSAKVNFNYWPQYQIVNISLVSTSVDQNINNNFSWFITTVINGILCYFVCLPCDVVVSVVFFQYCFIKVLLLKKVVHLLDLCAIVNRYCFSLCTVVIITLLPPLCQIRRMVTIRKLL